MRVLSLVDNIKIRVYTKHGTSTKTVTVGTNVFGLEHLNNRKSIALLLTL